MKHFLLAVLFAFPIISQAGAKALVIVDMQDVFVTSHNHHLRRKNAELVNNISQKQREMIEVAKRNQIPIMVVEYAGLGATNKALMDTIGDYPKVVTVFKSMDGLYDDKESAALAKEKLSAWGTSELIVMGANGSACVFRTIKGALDSGYKVWAYKSGIADFTKRTFVNPYSYRNYTEFSDMQQVGLREFAQPDQVVNFRKMPRGEAPSVSASR